LLRTFLPETQTFGLALIIVTVIAGIGIVAAILLPPMRFNKEKQR
jgi:hypothetical protein